MPVTLEIAGRAVSRLGSAAPNAPVVVRDVTSLVTTPTVWSGVTDENGYFITPLLDDAKVYRADVQYDINNQYKAVRDIASGQMNMLQVRKRLHVHGAATPAVFDGPVTIAANVTVSGVIDATAMRRGGQNLWGPDNDGAGSGLDADLLDGQQAAAFAAAAHAHATYSPTTHDHAGVYAPPHAHPYAADSHAHAGVYAPSIHGHDGLYLKAVNGVYAGNGATGRSIQPIAGTPILGMIWENSGAGVGATWFLQGQSATVGQGNTATSDEFINASGHVSIHTGALLVGVAGGANGLGANISGVSYAYLILYI